MKKVIKIIICILLVSVFAFSAFQVISILLSRHTAKVHYESYDKYIITSTEPVNEEKQTENAEEPITKNITIDFKSFIHDYPNAIGWIYSQGANLNYPVMQGSNNSYYIDHLPDGSKNIAGSLFADFRNSEPNVDSNYIIYGHNMNNGSMFGSITNYMHQEYYDKYPYIDFYTLNQDYKIDLIAGCTVSVDSDIFNINLDDENYINELISNSTFISNTTFNKNDKLVTLSTCTNVSDDTRYVLIGVLKDSI